MQERLIASKITSAIKNKPGTFLQQIWIQYEDDIIYARGVVGAVIKNAF